MKEKIIKNCKNFPKKKVGKNIYQKKTQSQTLIKRKIQTTHTKSHKGKYSSVARISSFWGGNPGLSVGRGSFSWGGKPAYSSVGRISSFWGGNPGFSVGRGSLTWGGNPG